MKKLLMLLLCGLYGCTVGNGHICGPQTPAAYCDKEAYESLMHPKPYGVRWVKEGMTRDGRREDAWACGAARTLIAADGPVFSDNDVERERRATDTSGYGPRGRLFDRWGQCMESRGYRYVEVCDSRCLYP